MWQYHNSLLCESARGDNVMFPLWPCPLPMGLLFGSEYHPCSYAPSGDPEGSSRFHEQRGCMCTWLGNQLGISVSGLLQVGSYKDRCLYNSSKQEVSHLLQQGQVRPSLDRLPWQVVPCTCFHHCHSSRRSWKKFKGKSQVVFWSLHGGPAALVSHATKHFWRHLSPLSTIPRSSPVESLSGAFP